MFREGYGTTCPQPRPEPVPQPARTGHDAIVGTTAGPPGRAVRRVLTGSAAAVAGHITRAQHRPHPYDPLAMSSYRGAIRRPVTRDRGLKISPGPGISAGLTPGPSGVNSRPFLRPVINARSNCVRAICRAAARVRRRGCGRGGRRRPRAKSGPVTTLVSGPGLWPPAAWPWTSALANRALTGNRPMTDGNWPAGPVGGPSAGRDRLISATFPGACASVSSRSCYLTLPAPRVPVSTVGFAVV
jgi:hypothetical protein